MRPFRSLRSLAVAASVAALAACSTKDNASADSATAMNANGTPAAATDSAARPADTTMSGGDVNVPAATLPQMTDAEIMAAVSASNANEIAAGKLAKQKGASGDVKDFGGDIAEDHEKLQKDGDKLVTDEKLTPAKPSKAADSVVAEGKKMAAELGKLSGAAFDKAYIDAQVMGHTNTLAFLKAAAPMAQDAKAKQMLMDAQPKVADHLKRAREIQSKLGAAGTDTTKH